jgi:hypothetical protein
MNNVTATLKAWLPEYSCLKPEDLHTEKAVNEMVFSACDMRRSGWTHVGNATITVDLILTPDQLIASKIETLKTQQAKIRAEAQERVNELEAMVQNLLAITYTPEAS